jgi:hypothetical protein
MPADYDSCDVNELLASSACFQEICMGQSARDAIEIYARVQNLAASGGTDYTADTNGLLQAAKEWQPLSKNQMDAIDLYIDIQNAISNGADFETDVNSLMSAAACYRCLGTQTQKTVLDYLKCAINSLGEPD